MTNSSRTISAKLANDNESNIAATNKPSIVPLIQAAAISGLPADIISFPFSRIKTVKMTQGAAQSSGTVQQLGGLRHSCSVIYDTQGLPGFFRGLSPILATTIPGTVLFFIGMQTTKDATNNSGLGNAVSGLVGQVAGSAVWVPSSVLTELRQMSVIKPELQALSVSGLIRHIVHTEGLRGLYRGFVPQLATFGPFNSLGTYLSSQLINKTDATSSYKVFTTFAGYAVGFGAAAFITTPCDVIKTRIQVGAANPELFPDRSIVSCTKQVVKTEGVKALFSGAVERTLWLGVRQGLAFTIFEMAYAHLTKSNTKTTDTPEAPTPSLRR